MFQLHCLGYYFISIGTTSPSVTLTSTQDDAQHISYVSLYVHRMPVACQPVSTSGTRRMHFTPHVNRSLELASSHQVLHLTVGTMSWKNCYIGIALARVRSYNNASSSWTQLII